ncbi:hypothetical protein [uncultured Hoeflea sp.]|uniref:hypothetical protein n=1 Tax=uncultured Hoeflea sp. TaxID=538666 RepID=UPI00260E1932|nr:hypothetical protein [uncultured Hoeflea sp.]
MSDPSPVLKSLIKTRIREEFKRGTPATETLKLVRQLFQCNEQQALTLFKEMAAARSSEDRPKH